MKLTILLAFILLSTHGFGQFSNPYKKYSSDSSYYLISKPYSNQEYDTLGKTTIYSKDGSVEWQIGRYFAGESVFLGNNGNVLTFIVPFNDDERPISVYKNSSFNMGYGLSELVDLENGYCNKSWIFSTFFMGGVEDTINFHNQGVIVHKEYEADSTESLMERRRYYTSGDTLFLVTCENQILKLDLNSGQIIDTISNAYQYFNDGIVHPDSLITVVTELEYGREFGIPEMKNGEPFDETLARRLGWKNISIDELGAYQPKQGVTINIEVLINKKGKAEILSLDTSDESSKKIIRRFINDAEFSVEPYVKAVGKKYYFDILQMDKKGKTVPNNKK